MHSEDSIDLEVKSAMGLDEVSITSLESGREAIALALSDESADEAELVASGSRKRGVKRRTMEHDSPRTSKHHKLGHTKSGCTPRTNSAMRPVSTRVLQLSPTSTSNSKSNPGLVEVIDLTTGAGPVPKKCLFQDSSDDGDGIVPDLAPSLHGSDIDWGSVLGLDDVDLSLSERNEKRRTRGEMDVGGRVPLRPVRSSDLEVQSAMGSDEVSITSLESGREVIALALSDESADEAEVVVSGSRKRGVKRRAMEHDSQRTSKHHKLGHTKSGCTSRSNSAMRQVSTKALVVLRTAASKSKRGSIEGALVPQNGRNSHEIAKHPVNNGLRLSTAETVGRLWIKNVENMNPRIFCSPEARLEVRVKAEQGKSAYDGIGVTATNCEGLRSVLGYYRAKKRWTNRGTKHRDISALSTTVSQFLRWCVASASCNKYDVWRQECLFRNVSKLHLVEQFLDYFMDCCGRRTVRKKAEGLFVICKAACETATRTRQPEFDRVLLLLESFVNKRMKRL